MSKHNYFVKILKKVNISINSQLEKYLNKLNFSNPKNKISNFLRSLRALLALIMLIILGFTYLSIPFFFDKMKLQTQFKNQLAQKFDSNFSFSENLNYSFFPVPNFTFRDVSILKNNKNLANVKHLRINISFKNLFSLNSIKIKDIFLENSNFNFYKDNANFFIKLLKNDFSDSSIKVIDSNIFFKNFEEEVLFINKINNMKYYYDDKNSQNILYTENEIFNLPYSLELKDHETEKKIFTKFNLNILKLKIENELDYNNVTKNGLVNSIYNKNKSKINYKFNKDYLNFDFFDKSIDSKFNYKGNVNFKPFYANIAGSMNKINISNLFNSESILIELFKTGIFNNKNLSLNAALNSKKILPYQNFNDLIINFKIKEGLIDIDDTKFNWSNSANFLIFDSLLYLNDNNLVLDGQIIADVSNYNEIYKTLQTPRNYRSAIEKVEFNFNYNFDQQTMNLNNIKINGRINQEVNNILNEFVSKKTSLQNKIYLKNLINQAIKSYAG